MAASGPPGDVSDSVTSCDISDIKVTMKNGAAYNSNGNAKCVSVSASGGGTADQWAGDQQEPANSRIVWDRNGAVTLRMEHDASPPVLVPTLLSDVATKHPDHPALGYKIDDKWTLIKYKEYYELARQTAKAFIKLGLEPANAVGILGFNSVEWFLANLGAIFAGGFACGLYTTNTAEACHYVASTSSANVIVVENQAQLAKILAVRSRLPLLRAIVQYKGTPSVKDPTIYAWSDFMALAKDVPDSALDERIRALRVNKCCTLIYTSGTTGMPKGVMLSHDNLTWTAKAVAKVANLQTASEVFISYLPLSHIAAQMLDLYLPISAAATVYFADADALKGSLAKTLQEVRPTGFLGVPRVWEKIEEKMKAVGKQSSAIRRSIAAWARDVGARGSASLQNGGSVPFGWTIANAVVFRKVREQLGFDRCRFFISGAAPIAMETLQFFASLYIPITEVYGMSESTGPQTIGFFTTEKQLWRVGSVGKTLTGTHTVLSNIDKDGNGEICMDGRNVFMGYINEEEKTKQTFDADFRLRSGDIGKVDKDGYTYVTGRIKELIITAGGENVAPVPIEDAVKAALPVVSNCMVIGDRKKFLSLLICLKSELNPDSQEPLDALTVETKEWCKQLGSNATTVSQLAGNKDELINKAIQAGIEKANEQSESRAKKLQKFFILSKDFSVAGGELGPTLKMKRNVIDAQYREIIDSLYAGDGAE